MSVQPKPVDPIYLDDLEKRLDQSEGAHYSFVSINNEELRSLLAEVRACRAKMAEYEKLVAEYDQMVDKYNKLAMVGALITEFRAALARAKHGTKGAL